MNNETNVEEPMSEISWNRLKPIFEGDASFDDQLTTFLDSITLNDAEIEMQYEVVCFHLNRLFRKNFPKCNTYRFGSTVTGLCFKQCDLDIHMNIGEPLSNDDDERPNVRTYKKVFAEAKRLLYRNTKLFNRVIPLPKAKMPIIKFCYLPTNISCDLILKNSLGVHNSLLIKHYLSLDTRLKPVMMVIKYWAKHFNISTKMRGGNITNYSLVMLFIFYLEQTNVNLVPSVIELKKSCEAQIIEGWQVNFDKTLQHPSPDNKSTILELLHGFFDFYAKFNFKQNVICPVDGKVYSKDIFKDIENLPESMKRYKEYVKNTENAWQLNVEKPMCIQDPTELNHNSTSNVSDFLLDVFQKHASVSSKVCSNALKSDCSKVLLNLFNTMPVMTRNSVKEVIIPIPIHNFLRVGRPDDFDTRMDISDKEKCTRENLFDVVFKIVKDIFEKVFKFKVQLLTVDREQKQQKIIAESDVNTKDNQKIILHCTGDRCLWRNRKCVSLEIDPSYSALEKETIITATMLKDLQKDNNEINLNLRCIFEKKQKPLSVILILSDTSSGKGFNEFASILRCKIPVIVKKTLSHMIQYQKSYIKFDKSDVTNTN